MQFWAPENNNVQNFSVGKTFDFSSKICYNADASGKVEAGESPFFALFRTNFALRTEQKTPIAQKIKLSAAKKLGEKSGAKLTEHS